ncbi:MAG: outer membrane beta-barrel protein [Gammaproteobacteria bacterium]|nr:outer membrane beta-barrel protein [Gammaproteobacteria bacterium]
MKKTFIFTVITTMLFLTSNSFAAERPDMTAGKTNLNPVIGSDAGFYAGFSAGSGGMDKKRPDHPPSVNEEHHYYGFVTRPYVGYLWSIPSVSSLKLGMELGYFSSFKPDEYILNNQTWIYFGYDVDLLGVVKYNVFGSSFFLEGKAGGAFVHQTVRMSGMGDPSSSTKNGLQPEVGLGVGYDFTSKFSMNFVITEIFGSPPPDLTYGDTNVDDVDSIIRTQSAMLGVTYHFG